MEKLRDEKGAVNIVILGVVLVLVLIISLYFEKIRLQIVAFGVRNAFETSITDISTENYDEVYPCIREGYSSAYKLNKSDKWESNIDKGNIVEQLKKSLGLVEEDGQLIKYNGDKIEFKLYDIKINILNRQLAPSDKTKLEKYRVNGQLILEIPSSYDGKTSYAKKDINVSSAYTSKY
ncbi:TPA: hypothetical protein KRE72_003422 [Clostridioides difficile]|uniref:Uncharacterized protein n=1 Tax=Clostridioides difficile TaxID=1496 RepID=A0AB74QGK9_CLODI|nr:hypothetical protein [Clostridioides difficile]MCF2715128.1 hypothetical protein [Clostridioides difficile]MDI3042323.1 hypothetical protein [Clostridioides difficile]MDX5659768.1 hypothetical protein [Clostridioides difficile]VFD35905.1 Uncharacterised protein [Clostridioides difficile]VHX53450.1 Uncharacterised protein [Clostridioides difficile]